MIRVWLAFQLSDAVRWIYRRFMGAFFWVLQALVWGMHRLGLPEAWTIAASARAYRVSRAIIVPLEVLSSRLQRRAVSALQRKLNADDDRKRRAAPPGCAESGSVSPNNTG